MRMYDHLAQGLIIAIIFVYTLFSLYTQFSFMINIIIFAVLGFFVGILYPDVDCKDSIIFKIKKGSEKSYDRTKKIHLLLIYIQKVKNFIFTLLSILLIPVSYTLKYIVYYPTHFLFKLFEKKLPHKELPIKSGHRFLAHSIPGLLFATFLIFTYFIIVSQRYPFSIYYILSFTSLFLMGAILHLLQDSSIKILLYPFYPFSSFNMKGELTSEFYDTRASILFFVLMGLSIIDYFIIGTIYSFISGLTGIYELKFLSIVLFNIMVLSIIYYVFLFPVCNVKFDKENELKNKSTLIMGSLFVAYILFSWLAILYHNHLISFA